MIFGSKCERLFSSLNQLALDLAVYLDISPIGSEI